MCLCLPCVCVQPPGFRRAYSSPLYSSQQNATVSQLLPFCESSTDSPNPQHTFLTWSVVCFKLINLNQHIGCDLIVSLSDALILPAHWIPKIAALKSPVFNCSY